MVYLIIIQILHKTYFKKFLARIAQITQKFLKIFNEGRTYDDCIKEMFNINRIKYIFYEHKEVKESTITRKSTPKKSRKHKILYLYIYSYFNIFWQLIFSKITVRFYT